MYPRAGGQYVFLRESMGPLIGFLYGWTLLVVIQTGTIAAVAVAFASFPGVLWPAISTERYGWFPQFQVATPGGNVEFGLSPQRVIALVSVWILAWVNLRGVREGKILQTTLTFIKVAMLAGAVAVSLLIADKARAQALSGLVVVLLGVPVYFFWRGTTR